MTNMKTTKRALLSSVLALFLCFAMLLGTTYAWFTDSVTSSNNIITSGNLDVELEYYDGDSWEKVTATTNVFEENTFWEPGHTEVVYLKVSNLGSLALKYKLGINIVSEIESINVKGDALRLSDYIEFATIDDVTTPYADRAAARAAVTNAKVLSAGHTKTGEIDAGAAAQYVALVVYMPESVGNEANYRTGEVAPEIKLGINLMATQDTVEEDSFDATYDEDAMFGGVPVANVVVLSKLPEVTTLNGNKVTLDAGYVFSTTEDYDSAQMNAHRYWHADFVATFDRDVDDEDVGLAGQYDAYSAEWLAFELDGFGDIAANTPVRMLEFAGISMNYEELCDFVKKFSCGAFAVDPEAMAGTTLTVELRLYETTIDPNASSGSANIETGEYITIGTYSHTFASVPVSNQAELSEALEAGIGGIELAAGTYKLPSEVKGKTVTISGDKDTKIDVTSGLNYINGSNITFDGVTIQSKPAGAGYENGFADAEYTVFNNCVIEGTLGLDYSCEFNNCEFKVSGNYYNVWTWGAGEATFNGCTFNCDGKALLVYANVLDNDTTHQTVKITDCVFNDNGDDTVTGKAAIEITNTYTPVRTYDVIIENTTVNGFAQTVPGAGDFNAAYGSVEGSDIGTNVWGNKCKLPNTQINVEIDGVDVY